jgi:hypothetical protein
MGSSWEGRCCLGDGVLRSRRWWTVRPLSSTHEHPRTLGCGSICQVLPLLRELWDDMNKIGSLKDDFEGKIKIKKWFTDLNGKQAHDELDEVHCFLTVVSLIAAEACLFT